MTAYHRFLVRLGVGGVVSALVLAALLSTGAVARSAEGVNLINQDVTCDSIMVTYMVLTAQELDYGLIYAHRADGSQIGLVTGPGSTGQHTVTVSFPVEPAGTSLYARVSIGSGDSGRVEAQGTPTECAGGGDAGDTGSGDIMRDDSASSESGSSPPAWEGYSDGRLNPDPAEYYSVWCAFDRIDVYRSVPQSELLKMISLADVIELSSIGGAMDLGDFMTLVRNSEDTITIYGSNGNQAPTHGSKAFSLAECVERNGGLPEVPSPPPPDASETPAENEEADARQDVLDSIEFCLESQEFFGSDPESFVWCLQGVAEQEGASSLEILWVRLFQACPGVPLASAPLLFGLVRLRRFRRQRQ